MLLPGISAQASSFDEESLVVIPVVTSADTRGNALEYRDAIEEGVKRKERYGVLALEQAQERAISVAPMHYEDAVERFRATETALSQAEEIVFTDPAAALPNIEIVLNDLDSLVGLISPSLGFEDTLFKAHMMKARALMDAGKRDDARAQLLLVVRVFGTDAEVTRASFHPSIVALYEEVLKSDAGGETGNLEVNASVKGATIYVSGRKIDLKTDAVIPGLVQGALSVRTVTDTGRSKSYPVEIRAGETTSVNVDHAFEASIELSERAIVVRNDGQWDQNLLAESGARLAEALGVDNVLLAGVSEGQPGNKLHGLLVNVSGGVIASNDIPVQRDVVSYKKASELVDLLGIKRGGADASFTLEGPWYEDYVAWSLVGVGVVGIVLGAVKGLEYQELKDEVETAVRIGQPGGTHTDAEIFALADETESAGTISSVSLGLGIAALVGGTTMFLLHEGEDSGTAMYDRSAPYFTLSPGVNPNGSLSGATMELGFSF